MPSPLALNARKTAAGTIIPPSAAIAGSATARRSRSSPTTSSRLISIPTTKKNTAINKSLTTWPRSSWNTYDPNSNRTLVAHSDSYPDFHGEFAHTNATTLATPSTIPPAASMWEKRTNGRTARASVRSLCRNVG